MEEIFHCTLRPDDLTYLIYQVPKFIEQVIIGNHNNAIFHIIDSNYEIQIKRKREGSRYNIRVLKNNELIKNRNDFKKKLKNLNQK